jgi:hypothetical protein
MRATFGLGASVMSRGYGRRLGQCVTQQWKACRTAGAPALCRCFHRFFHLRVTQAGECRS